MDDKNRFLKSIKERNIDFTIEELQKIIEKKALSTDGVSIALLINWLQDNRPSLRINRKSNKQIIKWLKFEMRWDNDYGSYNPFVCDLVKYYYEQLLSEKLYQQEKQKRGIKEC